MNQPDIENARSIAKLFHCDGCLQSPQHDYLSWLSMAQRLTMAQLLHSQVLQQTAKTQRAGLGFSSLPTDSPSTRRVEEQQTLPPMV
jgi:hypothetical protein